MNQLRDNPDGTCNCSPLGGGCFFTHSLNPDLPCDCKCHQSPKTNEELVEEMRQKYALFGDKGYSHDLLQAIRQALATKDAACKNEVQEGRERLADWIQNHKGVSSTAIFVYMTTGKLPRPFDCPSDESDRARCVVLLKAVPEWQSRLSEIEQADIKGTRNGKEVFPWREQIPLIRAALELSSADKTT